MKREDARPGLRVVYYPVPGGQGEHGEVIRVSRGGLVFVRYDGSATPKATRPEDLYAMPGQLS